MMALPSIAFHFGTGQPPKSHLPMCNVELHLLRAEFIHGIALGEDDARLDNIRRAARPVSKST